MLRKDFPPNTLAVCRGLLCEAQRMEDEDKGRTTMKTKVANRRHGRPGPRDVYVGRPSKWGNPWRESPKMDRNEVVERYRRHLTEKVRSGAIAVSELAELADKTLWCWCAPQACHADIIAAAADWAAAGAPEPAGWMDPSATPTGNQQPTAEVGAAITS